MPFDENAARIQTVSSVPCPHGDHVNNPYASRRGSCRVADVVCMRTKDGTWWQITELHPPIVCDAAASSCAKDSNGVKYHGNGNAGAEWNDSDTPGAVQHTNPEPEPAKRASPKMVDAAMESLLQGVPDLPWLSRGDIRDLIEAALAAEDK
jgi:hypothetical protein